MFVFFSFKQLDNLTFRTQPEKTAVTSSDARRGDTGLKRMKPYLLWTSVPLTVGLLAWAWWRELGLFKLTVLAAHVSVLSYITRLIKRLYRLLSTRTRPETAETYSHSMRRDTAVGLLTRLLLWASVYVITSVGVMGLGLEINIWEILLVLVLFDAASGIYRMTLKKFRIQTET